MDNLVNKIRLGMIGYNEGNGHPYSFSAIINGYNQELLDKSPYPVIANYLKKRQKEEFGVKNLSVDFVWTPFPEISKNISECCFIKNHSGHYLDFLDEIDAIIIARDDSETHIEIAKPFLDAGKKVFIDKPLCSNQNDLDFFIPYLENGMVMSCSGFRFHPNSIDRQFLAEKYSKIVCASAITTIDWNKYGIHLLEALHPLMDSPIFSIQNIGTQSNDFVKVTYENGKYACIIKDNLLRGFTANFYCSDGSHFQLNFNDNFTYFRNLLFEFHSFLTENKTSYDFKQTINLIEALIKAKDSKGKGGSLILINKP